MTAKIFCLEGEWEKSLKPKYSVESYLKYLDEAFGVGYIYRKVNSRDSLRKYLNAIIKKEYDNYSVVYLAFHGESKKIEIDHSENIDLDQLAKLAGDSFQNRIIHFGSCRTLLGSETKLQMFRKSTGAKMISGYTKSIDFFDASLLDMAFLKNIVEYERPGHIENWIKDKYPRLSKDLGFKVIR
ncbi:DUF6642 family protein [Algoriphagus halophilus]|uniref:CHAT domain-containing protein n=1 Tax=Algoriphagus halophilus TaxID=226505 RepID=A0A1N6D5Y0_9BACT|nr:DUF6642 family protein [Algoriphagus halophilus]SIN66202.1 hypothetical protein SAMN05444394_0295 [Algoriphagus halophilus]